MLIKFPIITVLWIIGANLAFGQVIDNESNWFKLVKGVDDYNSRFDFTRYSKEDILTAAPIFKQIEMTKPTNEWEGVYSTGAAIGQAELRWRSRNGYVFHFVYHTLSNLDYGAVIEDSISVKLNSRRVRKKKRVPLLEDRLMKVQVGKKHYLVPESSLKDFAERAVGREVTSDEEWSYWWRVDETELKSEELPTFPKQYSHLVVAPIKTKILFIGRRKIVPSEATTREVNYDDIFISVTLAGGSANGLRRGMDFFIPHLGEWVEVTKVGKTRSVGRIRRDFSLERQEQCWDSEEGMGNPFPCKKLIKGLGAVTRPNEYF